MIELHRLDKSTIYLNHRIFEMLESMPDNTIISMTTERKYIVRENPEAIIQKIQEFENKIFSIKIPENVDKRKST